DCQVFNDKGEKVNREVPRIVWTDKVEFTADDILAQPAVGKTIKRVQAEGYLRKVLAEGALSTKEILRHGVAMWFSGKTLQRARERIGVTAKEERVGDQNRWFWELSKAQGAAPEPPKERLAS